MSIFPPEENIANALVNSRAPEGPTDFEALPKVRRKLLDETILSQPRKALSMLVPEAIYRSSSLT